MGDRGRSGGRTGRPNGLGPGEPGPGCPRRRRCGAHETVRGRLSRTDRHRLVRYRDPTRPRRRHRWPWRSPATPPGISAVSRCWPGSGLEHAHALRACVVRWGDLEAAAPVFEAIGVGSIDAWVFRPQASGDEEFHLAVTELLDEWASRHASAHEAVQVIGEQWAPRSQELRDMFIRNHVPTRFYDAAGPEGAELLESLGLENPELPVVVLRFRPERPVLINPNALQIAKAFGLLDNPSRSRRLRCRGHRRGTGRAQCGGVRLVRGPADRRGRAVGHGRPGGHQFPDPQLPRLPPRHQRWAARGQRVPTGLGVRHHLLVVAVADQHRRRRRPAGAAALRRQPADQPHRDRGHRVELATPRCARAE